jgi:hypothetical protein
LSSILKALKKLESETTEFSEERFLPQKIDRKRAFGQRAKESWLYDRLLSVSIFTVILVLGAWFFFNRETLLVGKRSPQTQPMETQAGPATTSPDPLPKAAPLNAALSTPPLEKRLESPAAAPAENPSGPISPRPENPPRAEAQDPSASLLQGQSVSEPSATPIAQSNLRLEAIIWSNKPESRFAVINGRIVRAGAVVDGIVVTEIGRDYVSLKSGRRNWKMAFRLE